MIPLTELNQQRILGVYACFLLLSTSTASVSRVEQCLEFGKNCLKCNQEECITCRYGFYGEQCSMPCSKACKWDCLRKSGRCVECAAGLFGEDCNQKCSANCARSKETEEPHCYRETGQCKEHCSPGYCSPWCDKKCPEHCVDNKCRFFDCTCAECEDGFHGQLCNCETSRNNTVFGLAVVSLCGLLLKWVIYLLHKKDVWKYVRRFGWRRLSGDQNDAAIQISKWSDLDAFHLRGYQATPGYIITKGPERGNRFRFCEMVYDKSSCIVLISSQDDEEAAYFLEPSHRCDTLEVVCSTFMTVNDSYRWRSISITKDGNTRCILFYNFYKWPKGNESLTCQDAFRDFLQKVRQNNKLIPSLPVVVLSAENQNGVHAFLTLDYTMDACEESMKPSVCYLADQRSQMFPKQVDLRRLETLHQTVFPPLVPKKSSRVKRTVLLTMVVIDLLFLITLIAVLHQHDVQNVAK